jgi:thioredoxin-like negative regulator of GroEL
MKRPAALLLGVVLAGTALRLAYCAAHYGVYHVSGDGEEGYYEVATSLLSSRSLSQGAPATEPSAFRGPLYPSFLAMADGPFPRSHPGRARLLQALLHGLAAAAVFALASFAVSPWAGLLAAVWTAFHPLLIEDSASLNVHAFYGLVMLAVAAAAALWADRPGKRTTVALGAALAASLLCRSAHFPLPVLLFAAGAWWWRRERGMPGRLALLTLATAVFLAPMVARNAWHFGRFVLLDTHKGSYIFLQGTAGPFVNTTVDEAMATAEALEPGFKARQLSGPPLYDALLRLGVENALRHPLRYAGYCAARFVSFWSWMWLPGLLALYGLWRRRGERRYVALFLCAASFVGYSVAGGTAEYRVSVLPVLLASAGGGLALLLERAGVRPPAWAKGVGGGERRILLASLGALFVLYAASLGFLARECLAYGRVGDVTASRGPVLIDARLVDVLRRSALAWGPRSQDAEIYTDVLTQWALKRKEAGDVAGEASVLREALRWAERRVRVLEPGPDEPPQARREARSRAYLARARLRMRTGADAVGDLKRAQALDPSSVPVAMTLAPLLASGGSARDALRLLAPGQSRAAFDALPAAVRARRLAVLSAVEARRGSLEASSSYLAEALALDARGVCLDSPEAGDRRLLQLFYFDACIRRLPEEPSLYVDRGIVHWSAGRRADAVADFRAALSLAPASLEAALSLGTALREMGRGREALSALNAALAATPARGSDVLRQRAESLRRELAKTRAR